MTGGLKRMILCTLPLFYLGLWVVLLFRLKLFCCRVRVHSVNLGAPVSSEILIKDTQALRQSY